MTLLGRVFTLLILVLSCAFFTVALVVNATHTKWRDEVVNPTSGLKAKNTALQNNVQELKSSLGAANLQLAEEQAARRLTLATLQSQLNDVRGELAQVTTTLRAAQSENTVKNQALATTQEELKRISEENAQLKTNINNVLEDRNGTRSKLIALTDQLNNLLVNLNSLERRKDDLNNTLTLSQAQLDSARAALVANGIDDDPEDVPPPNLSSVITSIGKNGLVEIAVGKDDGLRVGHRLEVYRDSKYLGRITIETVDFDKSTGRIDEGYRRGYIQVMDKVKSRL